MDILWSDPSANDTVLGVAPNLVRGGATLTYGPDRVRRFCIKNEIDLLIRAHECVGDGYQWFAGGRCVTVFSAANYCGARARSIRTHARIALHGTALCRHSNAWPCVYCHHDNGCQHIIMRVIHSTDNIGIRVHTLTYHVIHC